MTFLLSAGLDVNTRDTEGLTLLMIAVKEGHLTQQQADKITANATQRITELVNGTFPGRFGKRGMGPGGFGPGH